MPIHKRTKRKSQPLAAGAKHSGKSLAWYIVVPVVLLLSITAPWQRTVQNFFAPYLLLSNAAGNGVADQTLKMRSRSELASEVTRLNMENTRLIGEVNKLKNLEYENKNLRAMLELKAPPGYEYVACSVLLRDPWMWNSGFTIDRGSSDGLEPGLAVIAPAPDRNDRAILLGVIENVGKHSARVTSVLNPEFHISVSLPESGTVGFLNAGSFEQSSGGLVPVGFLPANGVFVRNEQLYTTGFEASIPGNLWLGSLESIESTTRPFGDRLYRRALMRPAADLAHLRTVMVARLQKNKESGSTEQ
jgi:rod shape-determining protein MreC